MSEEAVYKTYHFGIAVDNSDSAINVVFTETQEDTLQSFFDKLESGKFQTLSHRSGTFRLNTSKILSYYYEVKESL